MVVASDYNKIFYLIGVDEKNTNFLNENFEIEVFMEETETLKNGETRAKLTQLLFAPEDSVFFIYTY